MTYIWREFQVVQVSIENIGISKLSRFIAYCIIQCLLKWWRCLESPPQKKQNRWDLKLTIEFLKCFSKGFFLFFWCSSKDCKSKEQNEREHEQAGCRHIAHWFKDANNGAFFWQVGCCKRRASTRQKSFDSTLKQRPKTMDVLLMKLLSNSLEPCKRIINQFRETKWCCILQRNIDRETDSISSFPFPLCPSKVCYGQNSTAKWIVTVHITAFMNTTYHDDALWSAVIQNEHHIGSHN